MENVLAQIIGPCFAGKSREKDVLARFVTRLVVPSKKCAGPFYGSVFRGEIRGRRHKSLPAVISFSCNNTPMELSSVSLMLVCIAAIFFIGILGEVVFEKTGVPDVVWLIVVGIILGPVSGVVKRDQLLDMAPYFGALTLIIVLFQGGSKLRLNELGQAAGRSSFLALITFTFSVGSLAAASMGAASLGWLPPTWTWMHGLILGAILGGSSSVVIMPALEKAGLQPRLSNLVNLESAFTDVLCVVCTTALVKIMVSRGGGPDGGQSVGAALAILGKSFGIGLGVGAVAGMLALFALRAMSKSTYGYPIVLGTLMILYVVIDEMGGSAALGILAVAVLVGNAPALSTAVGFKDSASLGSNVEGVFGQVAFIIKSFFFTFIGAMLAPPWHMLCLGLAFGVLLLLARVPAVHLGTVGCGFTKSARGMVTVSMPRGMAAGVLAMFPASAGIAGTDQLTVVVFAAVFTTILVFAAGFPLMKRRMAEEPEDEPNVCLPADQTEFDPHASVFPEDHGSLS